MPPSRKHCLMLLWHNAWLYWGLQWVTIAIIFVMSCQCLASTWGQTNKQQILCDIGNCCIVIQDSSSTGLLQWPRLVFTILCIGPLWCHGNGWYLFGRDKPSCQDGMWFVSMAIGGTMRLSHSTFSKKRLISKNFSMYHSVKSPEKFSTKSYMDPLNYLVDYLQNQIWISAKCQSWFSREDIL